MQSLFEPDSIAVVGASSDLDRVSGRPVKYLLQHGYPGEVYPVNPNREEVGGLPCYPDVASLPEAPDLALVILPADLVPGVVEECFEAGVGSVLVVSSGFGEVDEEGRAAQRRLADLAADHGGTLVGPNSQGVIDFPGRVAASFTPALDREELLEGPVSFVTQSGAFGGALTTMLQEEGVGLHRWVATGNEAATGALDVLEHFVGDDGTDIAAGYVEAFADGRRLVELKRTDAGIEFPVVALKVGRSERGRSAAASHTGKVAGSHAVYRGVFRETGVIAVDDVDLFVAAIRALARGVALPGEALGVVSTSGGAGVHIADTAAEEGLRLPELDGPTRERIEEYVPEYGATANPVDLTGQVVNSTTAFRECLDALLGADPLDAVLLQITNASGESAVEYAELVAEVAADHPTPLFVCWTGGVDRGAGLATYEAAGVPVFENPARCVRTVAALARFADSRSRLRDAQDLPARPPSPDDAALDAAPAVLAEPEAKALLSEHGVSTPEATLVERPDGIPAAVEGVPTPAVAKLVSPDLHHRADVGGVRTGLGTPEAAARACRELFALGEDLGVAVDGVTLQEEIDGGAELSAGIQTGTDFGPVLMFGRGGADLERVGDVTFRTVPVGREQAASAFGDLATVDRDEFTAEQVAAVVDLLVALSDLYAAEPWIREADLNPVVVTDDGAVAVDALVLGPDG